MKQPLTLLTGLLLGAVLAVWLLPAFSDSFRAAPTPSPTPIPSPTPRVIQVDLEKARMVHKTIYSEMGYTAHLVGKEPTLSILGRTITEKEVLLITSGTCAAGIDYAEKPAVIEASGARALVRIAEPKLLSCGVTSVTYFDGKGVLPAPTELYNRLYDQAVLEIKTRAEQSDLVARARENALAEVELHLRRLGFEQVTVETGAHQ